MKTTIYSTDHKKIAIVENGYIWDCSKDLIIGHLDNKNTYPKNIFLKKSFMGYVDEFTGYSDYNKINFYAENNTIYDSDNNIIAYFKGKSHEAIAGSIICLALKLTTPIQDTQTVVDDAYYKSNFKPTVFFGAVINDGPKFILSMLIIIGLSLIIGIYTIEWFYNTFVKDTNFFFLICYILPIILVHILVPIKLYPKLLHQNTGIISTVMLKIILYTLLCACIAEFVTIITIYSTAMEEVYIFLTLLAIVPIYVLISLPFSIITSLITSFVLKFK